MTKASPVKKNKKLLAAAILLGLSWFPMVYLAKFVSPLYTFSDTDWWLNMSPWRLIVGIVIYLVIIPILLKKYFKNDSYFEITGLTLPKTIKQWIVGLGLIAVSLLIAFYVKLPLDKLVFDFSTPLSALANIQPAFIEEIMMRGLFIYMMVKAGYNNWVTITLGVLLFTTWHVASFGLAEGVITGLISVPIMFLPRLITNGVYVPVVLHSFTNSKIINLYSIVALLFIEIGYLITQKRKRKLTRFN